MERNAFGAQAAPAHIIDDPVIKTVLLNNGTHIRDLKKKYKKAYNRPKPEISRVLAAARTIA